MCGIVGFLVPDSDEAPRLASSLETLASLDPEGDRSEDFDRAGRKAESLSLSLIHPGAIIPLLQDEGKRRLLRSAVDRLSGLLKTSEAGASRPGVPLSEAEAWNAATVRFRDARWRLQKDLLENLPKVRGLYESDVGLEKIDSKQVLRHAFRLNVIMNGLDRLEVRGRDSAGIGTVVWFPDPGAFEGFIRRIQERGEEDAFHDRKKLPDLVHGSILAAGGSRPALVFLHKTAEEIGRLGQNVARLRDAVSNDRLYWAAVGAAGAKSEVLAHTRWASNGIVNEANCHPVDDRSLLDDDGPRFLAVLNGDIDNYQTLRDRFFARGRPVPLGITTDAKIIPMVMAEKYRETGNVSEAFRAALREFEGAFAIALVCTAEPGVVHLAIKGSGQALYVGEGPSGLMVASETYGLVEACRRYIRMDGERRRIVGKRETAGQILSLTATSSFPEDLKLRSFDGGAWPEPPAVFEAEITTRDIHRGDFEHYFYKEITEAPGSFEKTIRGKFFIRDEGGDRKPVFAFGPETVPPEILERFRNGALRRVCFIGQGTASVAALGIARLWTGFLGRTDMVFSGLKASELSGFGLERDMSDTLVVAVSQSGTTTDTNRTVERVKGRGAAVLGIVNRRHSDLVHRADGVIYTGDGRDVEMSVASTKAFYTQVAAGYLLGLYIAHILRALSEEEIVRRLSGLERMPDLMRNLLQRADGIRKLAEAHAVTKRHWAVVGSGLDRIASEEIRIKLSELNYKSISCDFLEDKKHIDLSAEPLILVCTASQPPAHVPDAVKEVSIFRAHRATPLVIAPDGEERYGPYADGVIFVPVGVPELAFLLETMAGHLFGYFAARAIDAGAELLKEARAAVVQALPFARSHKGTALAGVLRLLRNRIARPGREFFRRVRKGLYNSGMEVETATELLALFAYMLGEVPLREFRRDFGERGTWEGLLGRFLVTVSRSIGELTRPIDAIKHQAKTVTVGISREELTLSGPLFDTLALASFPAESLDDAERYVLEGATRAIAEVKGYSLYEIIGLDETGMPLDTATIRIVRQGGMATTLPSRAAVGRPLFGTKRRVMTRGRVWLGSGRSDGRPVVVIPGLPEEGKAPMILIHVEYRTDLPLEDTLHVLRGYYERYDEIRWAASEIDQNFTDAKLEGFPILALLEEDPNALALRILKKSQ